MISMFFLQADHSYADHLCQSLRRDSLVTVQQSQTHRILGWKGTSVIIWSNKYLGGSSICDT